jgi:hypothetical protein
MKHGKTLLLIALTFIAFSKSNAQFDFFESKTTIHFQKSGRSNQKLKLNIIM